MVFVLYNAQKIRQKHTMFVELKDYIPVLQDLQHDLTIPKESSHLVYLALADDKRLIDSNIMYSILRKDLSEPMFTGLYMWKSEMNLIENHST